MRMYFPPPPPPPPPPPKTGRLLADLSLLHFFRCFVFVRQGHPCHHLFFKALHGPPASVCSTVWRFEAPSNSPIGTRVQFRQPPVFLAVGVSCPLSQFLRIRFRLCTKTPSTSLQAKPVRIRGPPPSFFPIRSFDPVSSGQCPPFFKFVNALHPPRRR